MVECALDDVFLVVEEVLRIIHSRFGDDGKKEIDENTLFAQAEEKLYNGHDKNVVIKMLTGSLKNKIRNKLHGSSKQNNSNKNPSQLPTTRGLSAVSNRIPTAVSEQNKKKHTQNISGATISNHIQNMVSKKLDQSVITKNISKKTNENPVRSSLSNHIHVVDQEKVQNIEASNTIKTYSNKSGITKTVNRNINENPMKSYVSAHIHKVVQEKVRNQEPSNSIQKASNESVINKVNIEKQDGNPRKSFISTHIHKVVQEKLHNQGNSSSNVIHKPSNKSTMDRICDDQLKLLNNHRKNDQSNQRINKEIEVRGRENPKLPFVIDIAEPQSKMLKKNLNIRSSDLDNSIEVLSAEADISVEVVSILQSENKMSSILDNSIEVLSTLQSESTIKLNQYSLIENMDDDQFINLICRLFPHVDRDEFGKMVRKFNKSYNKVIILQTFISKSEEEGMKVPEEAYKYLSRINPNKRRSETEIDNGLRKCPKLEKASISINFNNSKISSSLDNASVCNNVCLKETHNEKQPKLSEKSNNSMIPSNNQYPNYISVVKSNSLGLNTFTNKNANIRNIFIEEKIQFLCNILQNTNREIIRKQVEKCFTDEDVEMLLNGLLEKEKVSSNDRLMYRSNIIPSSTLNKASTSTSQTIQSNKSTPLELVNNSNSVCSRAIGVHETDIAPVVVHQAASSGSFISKDIAADSLQRKSIINNQVKQLQEIFIDADPLYLLKWCSTIKGDQEKLQQLVDEMLVKRDYPKIKKENEIIADPVTNKTSREILTNKQRIEHPRQPNLLLTNHSQHFGRRRVQNEPTNLESMKHIIFIDLDNWSCFFKKLMRPLPDLTFVWGFHGGASQWREPIGCQNFNRCKAKKLFHLQEKCSNRKDAADFALCLKVGRMDERLPIEIAFTVLSGDAGFYEVELQMRGCDRRVVVINPHHKAPIELQLLLESVGEA